jgi:hypothetical protein
MKAAMKRTLVLLAALLAFARIPSDTAACGGPDYADLGPVAPLDATLAMIIDLDTDGGASWGAQVAPEFRFLYPFWKARPAELEALWHFAYDEAADIPAPSVAALETALRAGKVADAEREARAIIEGVYRMPPVPAAHHQVLFWRAVEVVDLAPHLTGLSADAVRAWFFGPTAPTGVAPALAAALSARRGYETRAALPAASGNPRAPSIEYWTLQQHVRSRIPDGWGDAVRHNTQPAVFNELLRETDAWLGRYPRHPLGDLARLTKSRIRYFQGEYDAAWDNALALFPARRVRALSEMRYLLLQNAYPSARVTAKIQDFELTTALVTQDSLDAARFPILWRRARAAPPGVTRTNLEERLLAWAAQNTSPGKLPPSFPIDAEEPTPLWGKLRAIALLKAEQWDRAREQLALLPPSDERTRLSGYLLVRTGHPEAAAALPGVDPRARQYLIGALLTDAQVDSLAKSDDAKIRAMAEFEAAVRRARHDQWGEVVGLVDKSRADRAALFRSAKDVALGKGADRDLAWARFLDAHAGELFSDGDPGFYRAVSDREEKLPSGARERTQIRDMLMRSTERWLALESYTRWLLAHPHAPDARDVLDEADRVFNRLINFGGADTFFWGRTAKGTSTIADLLRVGAEIRKGKNK